MSLSSTDFHTKVVTSRAVSSNHKVKYLPYLKVSQLIFPLNFIGKSRVLRCVNKSYNQMFLARSSPSIRNV